jgi:predicted NAD-dependent protein-ADP-ribosyltransferase YbiA (DUF1768 family)
MSDKKILEESVVNFFSGKKEYRSLSNFWENDVVIVINDTVRTYESGEHCFHGEKYFRIGEHCKDEKRRESLISHGMKFIKPSLYKNCAEAKKMGGKKGLAFTMEEIMLWDNISQVVQKEICDYKFRLYEQVRTDLTKSGNKLLIHPAMRCSEEKLETRIWEGKGVIRDGKVSVIGGNALGNLWAKLRINAVL